MSDKIATRDNSFDALRGIAILCVVAIHAIILPDNVPAKGFEAVNFWAFVFFRQMLNFAVPAFLFISGYFCVRADLLGGGGGGTFSF